MPEKAVYRKRLYFGSELESYSLSWQGRQWGHEATSNIVSAVREPEDTWCSANFLLQSRAPVYRMVPHRCRAGLPTPANPDEKPPHRHAQTFVSLITLYPVMLTDDSSHQKK